MEVGGSPESATACLIAATTRVTRPFAAQACMKPLCTSGERPSHQVPRRGGWHTRQACTYIKGRAGYPVGIRLGAEEAVPGHARGHRSAAWEWCGMLRRGTWMSDSALRKEAVPRQDTTTVSPPQPISTCGNACGVMAVHADNCTGSLQPSLVAHSSDVMHVHARAYDGCKLDTWQVLQRRFCTVLLTSKLQHYTRSSQYTLACCTQIPEDCARQGCSDDQIDHQ